MKKIKKLTDEDYEFLFKRTPRICLDFIILNNKNKFLLVKRKIVPYKNFWCFPGGRIYYKETIEEALYRIIKTELNIYIVNFKFIGNMEIINDGNYLHSISMVYKRKISNNCILSDIRINEQANNFEFFDKIPNNMHPIHKNFLIENNFI